MAAPTLAASARGLYLWGVFLPSPAPTHSDANFLSEIRDQYLDFTKFAAGKVDDFTQLVPATESHFAGDRCDIPRPLQLPGAGGSSRWLSSQHTLGPAATRSWGPRRRPGRERGGHRLPRRPVQRRGAEAASALSGPGWPRLRLESWRPGA